MEVEFTKRITNEMTKLREKELMTQKIIDISEAINGGVVQNLTEPYSENAYEAFRQQYAREHAQDFNDAILASNYFTSHVKKPVLVTSAIYKHNYNNFDFSKNILNHGYYQINQTEFGTVGMLRSPDLNILADNPSINTFLTTAPMNAYKLFYNGKLLSEMNTYEESLISARISELFGDVVIIGDYLMYATLQTFFNSNVRNIVIIEENDDLYNQLKTNIEILNLGQSVCVEHVEPLRYLREHKSSISSLYIDRVQHSDDIYKNYHYSVELESCVSGAKTVNINDDLVLPPVQTLIFKYLSAKAGDDNYRRFFAQLAPHVYEFMEADKQLINHPSQLEYVLNPINFKHKI